VTGRGVQRLSEGAASWSDRSAGLAGLFVVDIAADPRNPSTLFAATNAGVYRSTDSGGSWTVATNGIPDTFVNTVVADPQLPETVYAGSRSGVFRSTDNGATWQPLTGGVALPTVAELGFDADGRTLYAATHTFGLAARTRFVPGTPGVGVDGDAPVLSRVSLSHRRFAVAGLASAAARRVPRGTTLRFTISEAAQVRIGILRSVLTKRHRLRLRRVGRLTRTVTAGRRRVRFSGRIRKRALKPGSYRMRITATDAAGNRSKAVVRKFRIVRG
jgi:hypothetical protein